MWHWAPQIMQLVNIDVHAISFELGEDQITYASYTVSYDVNLHDYTKFQGKALKYIYILHVPGTSRKGI